MKFALDLTLYSQLRIERHKLSPTCSRKKYCRQPWYDRIKVMVRRTTSILERSVVPTKRSLVSASLRSQVIQAACSERQLSAQTCRTHFRLATKPRGASESNLLRAADGCAASGQRLVDY